MTGIEHKEGKKRKKEVEEASNAQRTKSSTKDKMYEMYMNTVTRSSFV